MSKTSQSEPSCAFRFDQIGAERARRQYLDSPSPDVWGYYKQRRDMFADLSDDFKVLSEEYLTCIRQERIWQEKMDQFQADRTWAQRLSSAWHPYRISIRWLNYGMTRPVVNCLRSCILNVVF